MTTPSQDQTPDALTVTERYDALAEEFFDETHIMAPGKDMPSAMGGYEADWLRRKLFEQWTLTRKWKVHSVEQAARIAVIEEDSLKAHNAELEAFRDVLSGGYASTHANRLDPEIYGILDEVRILVIEKGEAATEYREHVAEMEKRIAALETVVEAAQTYVKAHDEWYRVFRTQGRDAAMFQSSDIDLARDNLIEVTAALAARTPEGT